MSISIFKEVMGNQIRNLFWNEDKITYQVTIDADREKYANVGEMLSKYFTNNIFFRKLWPQWFQIWKKRNKQSEIFQKRVYSM